MCYTPFLFAEDEWAQCAIPLIKKRLTKPNDVEQPIFISANSLSLTNQNHLKLNGQVVYEQRPDILIHTEELFFNKDDETLLSNTPSIFTSNTSLIKSQSLNFNGVTQSGEFNNISLQLLNSHRFITAEKLLQINKLENKLENFHYTSCEPNDNAWKLTSSSLTLNHKTGFGIAKNAKIYLFDIPIFYFPYFQFPIDNERHSGLLMPSLTLSSEKGSSIGLPFYWNIHPQLDTTIELNINNQRGLQINTETRFLTKNTKGVLTTSSLNDNKEDQKRYFYRLQQQAKIAGNLKLDLDIQSISDDQFFSDFSIHNLANKPDYLERHLSLKHTTNNWTSTLLYQNYQIIDESKSITSRPYEQWPKITSIGKFDLLSETTILNIEQSYINFKRDNSVNGERYIFNPSISREWANSYSFIKPRLSYSLSQYRLSHLDNTEESISRNLATLSIDSGLFFERMTGEENNLLHTLEPRLFYLQTPFKDQSNIPDFDSSNLSLNYTNLFSTNRFNGGDRIGDTQQLTLGLSSRFININSGLELFRMSIGQTFFNQDRRVQLTGTSISTKSTSDLFLELASNPFPYWKISANMTKQAETGFITQKNFILSRQQDNYIFNLSYRFKGTEDKIELEQSDISMVYPINAQWKIFIKKQYSIIDQQNVEQLLGTSYDSCCWSFSIIVQESADDNFEEFDRSIFFQLTLKGLSSIGRSNKDLLSKSISGFH